MEGVGKQGSGNVTRPRTTVEGWPSCAVRQRDRRLAAPPNGRSSDSISFELERSFAHFPRAYSLMGSFPVMSFSGAPLRLCLMLLLLLLAEMFVCRALSPDGTALLELKRSLVDNFGLLSDWSPGDDFPCTWTGVTCNTSGSVTALDLSHLNLTGALPTSATLPPTLATLNLCCNSLSGPLPPALFTNLSKLFCLDVSRNAFTGPFPAKAVSSLRSLLFLSAFSNNFTGALPAEISSLPLLQHLDLGGSFFQGPIPPQYGSFPKLTYLSLSGNSLTGQIPPELGNLTELQHMVLGYNKYQSNIPAELGCLSKLQYLDLCCTNLSGTIPPQLGNLTALDTLFLYRNALVGAIPPELGNMASLMSLDVSLNNLSGSIPPELGRLHNLTLLSLMFNSFNGTLPSEIGNLPSLLTLLVWSNSLSGSLPVQLGRNSTLQWVDVSSNMFTGSIPPDLCSHGNLTKLIMFSNSFTGQIPESLAKCQSLLRVRMQDNQLSGSIPNGFGSLIKLTRLELQRNKLNGTIPSDVSLSAKLNYLDVSHNFLEGTLSSNIWSLPNIESLYVTGNKLTGRIPSNFGECSFLTILDLSQNSLSGEIPAGLSNCQKLVTVQLQQNSLSGSIPSELAHLPELEVLDLSHNALTGLIPLDFINATTLETFNVSYNNLSGVVPSEGIFKTTSPSSLLGNPSLCGGVLAPCSGNGNTSGFSSDIGKRVTWSLAWLLGCVLVIFSVFLLAAGRVITMRYGFHVCHKETDGNLDEWPWRLTAFQRLTFTCNDVLEALKDENVVGRGGTGIVYKAEMPGGDIVAVKKLLSTQKEADFHKECAFKGEIDLLGSIRHRNIVRLLGYCSNNVHTLLIYEYMTNGSLGDALHSEQKANILADWVTRYNIAVGIAQGLCYLHHDCFPQVIHRDVKSNNILLDAQMEARVADFGVAKLIETNDSMSMIAGSYGYIAPEYAYTLKVNEKTDIYSFGVVLLELLTGRRPIECEFGDAVSIVEWVRVKMCSGASAGAAGKGAAAAGSEALDSNVGASCSSVQEEMLLVLRIALLCTSRFPRDRPSMRDVVTMLAEAKPRRKSSAALATRHNNNNNNNDDEGSTLSP